MADLLIKGKKMPKNCSYCDLYDIATDWCEAINDEILGFDPLATRFDGCPLVEVPAHGRLIDADALMREYEKAQKAMEAHGQEYSCSFLSAGLEVSTEWYCVEDMIDNAPTVIEASEVEQDA